MKLTVGYSGVYHVNPLGSFVVTLPILRSDRLSAKCHFVGFQNLATAH
jgi:hypothetical protein